MLTAEIRATLKEHTGQLGADDLIFVQASGANAAAIFGGDSPPLSRGDARVRRIPFPTRCAYMLALQIGGASLVVQHLFSDQQGCLDVDA